MAVGEGQPMGLSLAFGGPYIGFMACSGQDDAEAARQDCRTDERPKTERGGMC